MRAAQQVPGHGQHDGQRQDVPEVDRPEPPSALCRYSQHAVPWRFSERRSELLSWPWQHRLPLVLHHRSQRALGEMQRQLVRYKHIIFLECYAPNNYYKKRIRKSIQYYMPVCILKSILFRHRLHADRINLTMVKFIFSMYTQVPKIRVAAARARTAEPARPAAAHSLASVPWAFRETRVPQVRVITYYNYTYTVFYWHTMHYTITA